MCLGLLTFKEGTVAAFVIVVTRNLSNLGISFLCVWGPPSFGYWVRLALAFQHHFWCSILQISYLDLGLMWPRFHHTAPWRCRPSRALVAWCSSGLTGLSQRQAPAVRLPSHLLWGGMCLLGLLPGLLLGLEMAALCLNVCSCALVAKESRHAEVAFGEGQELLLQSASAGLQVRLSDQIDKTWSS